MTNYHLDASALIKRYVNEIGSFWIREQIETQQSSFFMMHFVITEVTSAFCRRVRESVLSPTEYQNLQKAFQEDCANDYTVVTAVGNIIDVASRLLEAHPLRALDALHLATALNINQMLVDHDYSALVFLCADGRLNAAATVEGLAVDNPNHHP